MRSNRDNGPEVNELELGNVFELYFITNVVYWKSLSALVSDCSMTGRKPFRLLDKGSIGLGRFKTWRR